MNYKKDIRYIIGVSLVAISIVLMVVTFALMGLGKDGAIIWFFVGAVGLVISNFILVSVKRRYETVFEDEPSALEVAKENLQSAKQNLFKRGVLGAVLSIILVVCFVVTAVVGIRTISTYYERNGALNAGYHFNLREAERFEELRIEETEKGNLKFAAEFEKNRDKCIEESAWYLNRYGELDQSLKAKIPVLIMVASVNGVVLLINIIFILVIRKQKQRNKED